MSAALAASTARVIMETVGWKLITTSSRWMLWASATNSSGHIFAGTCFGGGVFRSTDDRWTPVNKALDCNLCSLAIDPVETIFAETAGCGTRVYCSTDNGDSWTLANLGLTSTNVAEKICPVLLILPAVT